MRSPLNGQLLRSTEYLFRSLPHLNSKTFPSPFFGPPELDLDIGICLGGLDKGVYLLHIGLLSPDHPLRLGFHVWLCWLPAAQLLGVPFSS